MVCVRMMLCAFQLVRVHGLQCFLSLQVWCAAVAKYIRTIAFQLISNILRVVIPQYESTPVAGVVVGVLVAHVIAQSVAVTLPLAAYIYILPDVVVATKCDMYRHCSR
jgi:hypothetical protein